VQPDLSLQLPPRCHRCSHGCVRRRVRHALRCGWIHQDASRCLPFPPSWRSPREVTLRLDTSHISIIYGSRLLTLTSFSSFSDILCLVESLEQ
ncbi:hypothetical protein HYPSUDRAFT_88312, partial [Hypholoma sublateritium FD-334 SS-4]